MSMTDLIKEAYIDPIRSVMVVDDEYPTLSKLITGEDESKVADKERLQEVIRMCKEPDNNWMLDVHDGQFNGTGDVDNLHHSDLLILDYHLEGNGDDGRGEKALSVLSSLAEKEHFNLVVVHTKGYTDVGADLGYRAVFKDIVFHLQDQKLIPPIPKGLLKAKKIHDAIDAWEDEEAGILDSLVKSISDFEYLNLIMLNVAPDKIDSSVPELRELKLKYENRPLGEDDDLDKLEFKFLQWFVLWMKSEQLKERFGTKEFSDLRWSDSDEHMWVKAGNLFVCVVGKRIPTPELPERLLSAIEHWGPHPHRLLLAKIRHKLDEHGFTIASSVLSKQHTHAGWLRELLNSDEQDLEQQAWYTTQHHLEEMSWHYKDDLSNYLVRVVQALVANETPIDEVEKRYTSQDILTSDFEIFKFSNAFNNSLPVEGKNLTTGHILKNNQTGGLCLVVTPACDLVPGRKEGLHSIEVVVQQLYPISSALRQDSDEGVIEQGELFERCKEFVNTKQLVFIPINEKVEVYSTVSHLYKNANPNLMSLAFADEGKWGEGFILTSYNLNLALTPPQIRVCNYTVVGQLRYEYALHHSKTAGEHVSRIGLDYKR
ncbi:TPA: ABC transporter permease [Vibrio parahaemolyticus]|nr:ABC transporter permease [Vibrio parahaemolyticus]HCH0770127.1 ABC transporter permease [Vibrio parahaemolyticus]HCH1004913.1 ABC transporter permease [Vibrio parahaemolyticus]HCM1289562.1 ABC transporter permease [Vibrio parahaemolyticus]